RPRCGPRRVRRLGPCPARLRRQRPRVGRSRHPCADLGRRAPRDRAVLRHRGLPHRHRPRPRRRPLPRRGYRQAHRRGPDRRMNAISPSLTLVVVAGFLVATGVYLLLERALTRVLLGIVLVSNGVATLYLVASGPAKGAPLVGSRQSWEMSDPLPQAMVLTAIVIALASMA